MLYRASDECKYIDTEKIEEILGVPREDHEKLRNWHYVQLGQAISSVAMESIALGYLDIDEEIIENIKENRKGNAEAVTRDLIKRWANKHPRNQMEVSLAMVVNFTDI